MITIPMMTLDNTAEHRMQMAISIILNMFVSNSVQTLTMKEHGIKEIDRPGIIRVTSTVEEGKLLLSIYDNGCGFDLQDSSEKTLLRLGGVGLKNVDQRLRLQFGEDYHMEIQSEQDIFTLIKIYLPLSYDK